MAACIASTSSVELTQDGIGTLRADVILNPHPNNTLKYDAAGVVKSSLNSRYGYGAAFNLVSDQFAVPAIVAAGGSGAYGPTMVGTYQAPIANSYLTVVMNTEVRVGISASNPFAGIQCDLQISLDGSTWYSISTWEHFQGVPFISRVPLHGQQQLPVSDTAPHAVYGRTLVTATAVDVNVASSEKRYIDVIY
jgi:hypothetical protein